MHDAPRRGNQINPPKGRMLFPSKAGKPHRKHKTSRKCEPDCRCGRHVNDHKKDCACNRCKPYKPRDEQIFDRERRPDRCKCNHLLSSHDEFGCKTCERIDRVRMCLAFIPKYAIPKPTAKEHDYAKQVRANGFIAHNKEIATCTLCWMSVKIGFVHSISCVILAKAHHLRCIERRNKLVGNRPNRAG